MGRGEEGVRLNENERDDAAAGGDASGATVLAPTSDALASAMPLLFAVGVVPIFGVLLLPLAVGACAAFVVASTGHSLNDTPIPFLVAVSTLVMVGGQGASCAKIQGIKKEHHPNAVQ